jgi:hypothetical protein
MAQKVQTRVTRKKNVSVKWWFSGYYRYGDEMKRQILQVFVLSFKFHLFLRFLLPFLLLLLLERPGTPMACSGFALRDAAAESSLLLDATSRVSWNFLVEQEE